ncbi:hypothetical protein [Hydrogenophaga sp.]|uniref:hypothetical protein n=1 Tax=Hydrogenophaga sp. TaxID=1904254 RepID=UPI003565E44D
MPVSLVSEIRDSILMSMTDLKRMESLLDHAAGNLLACFDSTSVALDNQFRTTPGDLSAVRQNLHQAVTELQFHDLASQLIAHTNHILQRCALSLSHTDSGTPAPLSTPPRACPVTQSEMHAGSVELF